MYISDEDKEVDQADSNPEPQSADAEGDGEQNPDGGSRSSTKKKVILVIALILSMAFSAGGVLFFIKHKEDAEIKKVKEEEIAQKKQIFHDLDEFIVNLNTEGKSISFMKLKMTFDIEGVDNLKKVEEMMPRIRDVFQIYLRELRPYDVQGSVGLYRLREELLLRVNKIIYPAHINDILFKEIVVQ